MYWSLLVHLGFNMWREAEGPIRADYTNASQTLLFDDAVWERILCDCKAKGINTIVLDLGEGVRYHSHPELGAKGAWEPERLKKELARMRQWGITPIPKLNFSASHDEWLGPYSRCVSSEIYYQVCADLIQEVCAIFDKPALFHLGMDEERDDYAKYWGYAVMRHGDFWWNDLYYLFNEVEKNGVRPWIWADAAWQHKELFIQKMPKEILLSNWYYGPFFNDGVPENYVTTYDFLEEHGYDQIPCGMELNIYRTVKYAIETIAPERLKGFLQTTWQPVVPTRCYTYLAATDYLSQARAGFEGDASVFAGWTGKFERLSSYGGDSKVQKNGL